ncbi:MAG: ABC transporter permease subunit [Actinobacteria bacterium]|nr:ABC transporter permease subunit [Actinomycetota bacterium]
MTGLLAAEFLKLRTIRGTWGYLLTVVGLAGLVAAATIGSQSQQERLGRNFQADLVTDAAGVTTFIALLFGITLVTGEFRHGTITSALLATPRRAVLLAAKLLAGSAAGVALAALALLVVATVAVVWLSLIDVPLELGEAGGPAGRILVAALVAGAIGAAFGGVVHAQVPALVGALIWLLVAEPLLGGLLSLLDIGVADYLPASAVFAISDPTSGGLAFLPAVGVGLAHLAGVTILAWLRTAHRDIT